jgi:hypothetical protein
MIPWKAPAYALSQMTQMRKGELMAAAVAKVRRPTTVVYAPPASRVPEASRSCGQRTARTSRSLHKVYGGIACKRSSVMLHPAFHGPDERGTRWLAARVLQVLAADRGLQGVHTPTCAWGTTMQTCTTLSILLAGDPAPKDIQFSWSMIRDCGAGHRARQNQAITVIRRALSKLGLLPV